MPWATCPDHPHSPHRLVRRPQAAGDHRQRSLLPALPVSGVGHLRCPATPCQRGQHRGRCRHRGRSGGAGNGLRLAAGQAGERGGGRLGGRPSRRCPARRLGLPVREPPLPRCGRHRGGGDAAAPHRCHRPTPTPSTVPRVWVLGMQCKPMAAGAPSMPTTTMISSTTCRSPITARCWTPPPRT